MYCAHSGFKVESKSICSVVACWACLPHILTSKEAWKLNKMLGEENIRRGGPLSTYVSNQLGILKQEPMP